MFGKIFHQGSKSSTSGDWLGLGEDVTDEQLNTSLTTDKKSPEVGLGTTTSTELGSKAAEKKQDDELSKMLDVVPDETETKTDEDK